MFILVKHFCIPTSSGQKSFKRTAGGNVFSTIILYSQYLMKSPRWHIVIDTRAVSTLIIRRNQMALEKIGRVAIHSDVFVEHWWDTAGSWGRGLIPSDVAGQFPKDCRRVFFSEAVRQHSLRWQLEKRVVGGGVWYTRMSWVNSLKTAGGWQGWCQIKMSDEKWKRWVAGCGLIHFDVLSPLESLKMINTEGLLQMRTRHTWAGDNLKKRH